MASSVAAQDGRDPQAVIVGQVLGAHGLRGEVKIQSLTDNPARFRPGSRMSVQVRGAPRPLTVASLRPWRRALRVRFIEVSTRTAAEALRHAWLTVPPEQLDDLQPGSYWVHDIIGARVETETGRPVGRVGQVLMTGANDVYEVEPDASLPVTETVLLPATAEVIRQVDVRKGIVKVNLLPGLIGRGAEDSSPQP